MACQPRSSLCRLAWQLARPQPHLSPPRCHRPAKKHPACILRFTPLCLPTFRGTAGPSSAFSNSRSGCQGARCQAYPAFLPERATSRPLGPRFQVMSFDFCLTSLLPMSQRLDWGRPNISAACTPLPCHVPPSASLYPASQPRRTKADPSLPLLIRMTFGLRLSEMAAPPLIPCVSLRSEQACPTHLARTRDWNQIQYSKTNNQP